jgi:predicted RNase H-like HicB family nuclease
VRFYSFQIVIEKEAEGEGYFAYSPTAPGCFSNGKTIEETRRNMREAIRLHTASLSDRGKWNVWGDWLPLEDSTR